MDETIGIMEEPNLIVPRPFAAEPLEVLERSTSLDLTPERPAVRKTKSQGLRRSIQCKYTVIITICTMFSLKTTECILFFLNFHSHNLGI